MPLEYQQVKNASDGHGDIQKFARQHIGTRYGTAADLLSRVLD